MMSPYQRRAAPRAKPRSDGDVPMWQLAIGGIFITAGAMLAGVKIAEIVLAIWMPEALR